MSLIGIGIGITGLALILAFAWMAMLSMKQKRLDQEKRHKELEQRRSLEKHRKQERQDRVLKAESGDVSTILYLAKEAERTDYKSALNWYRKAAHLDNTIAMAGVVRMCERLDEKGMDEEAAYWRVTLSSFEGNSAAKLKRAECLLHGRGVERNTSRGEALLQELAKSGNLKGALALGRWYISDTCTPNDPNSSAQWFKHAMLLGSVEGMMHIGLAYIHGQGVKQSRIRGCYWLERAAETGNTEAMFHAGQAWMKHGAEGKCLAYIWLFLSTSLGRNESKPLRDQVGGTLDTDDTVYLQSVAKPLIGKYKKEAVGKHSIIHLLNQMYDRGIKIPKGASDDDIFRNDLLMHKADHSSEEDSPESHVSEGNVSENNISENNASVQSLASEQTATSDETINTDSISPSKVTEAKSNNNVNPKG
ncbi:sel1 repeat family protein [Vibrio sp.]|nr:sel1 repeat family protein [Vibrio sp.]